MAFTKIISLILTFLSGDLVVSLQRLNDERFMLPERNSSAQDTKSVLLMGGLIPVQDPFYEHTRTTEYWPEFGANCENKGILLPYAMGDSAAGVFENYVFYCGGYGILHDYDCTKSSVAGGDWISAPRMIHSRALFSIVSMESHMYAIGGDGEDTPRIQDTIEIFDGDSWKLADYKLTEPRYGHCSVRISQEEILVIGNFKGSTMDLINVADGSVTYFGNTTTEKYFFGCTFDEGKNVVYVSGGGNGRDGNNNIFEMLDLKTKVWTRLPDLRTPRVYHGMEIIDGKITVIGGFYDGNSRKNSLTAIEQYDPDNFQWTLVGDISVPRDEFAMVALKCS